MRLSLKYRRLVSTFAHLCLEAAIKTAGTALQWLARMSRTGHFIKQADSSITVDETEKILMETATPLTDSKFTESPNNGYGHGLVNVFDAVSAVTGGLGRAEGQVGKEGEDKSPPALNHQEITEIYSGSKTPLKVDVEDDVSIISVKLSYKTDDADWETIAAKQTSGDYKKGTYEVAVTVSEGKTLSYKWIVTDFGGNKTESKVYEVPISPAVTTGYKQDFENSASGWLTSGVKNSWERGIPQSGPNSRRHREKTYSQQI